MMRGVVGVATACHGDEEETLTVFGVLPPRFMQAIDAGWRELAKQGVRYVMSGPLVAAVEGGDSIGNATRNRGTLGCVVSDDLTSCDLILSCHHVLADPAGASTGDDVFHPAIPDGSAARIAGYERSVPISFNSSTVNRVDAAVARADGSVSRTIRSIGAMTGIERDPDFGTTVQKYGARTGHTHGNLQFKNLSFRNLYRVGNATLSALFEHQYGIVGDGSKPLFADGGDSGAVVVTTNNEAVGMVIGVATGIDLTVVTPIDVVESELGVSLCL